MKAVQINKYGGYDVLVVKKYVPRPTIGEGQALVEIYAASINPFDKTVRSGGMQKIVPLQFPITLGGDFSGVVKEIGEGVSEFKIGDEVYGSANIFSGGSGSFAEFATAKIRNVAMKPKNTSFQEAAALALVGSSAVQALEEHIKLQSGNKILIHGGAGGIGHVAIQLAKALGAYVATTVSSDDKEFVIQLGTDEIIDYKNEKFEEKIKDFDAILDTVGGEVTNKSLAVLRKGGTLVSMIGQPDLKLAEKLGVIAIRQRTRVSTQHLERLAQLVENGNIKIKIAKIFPLDQVREAFKYQEEGYPRGKVVIKVK
ncbi:hypothetical protein A2954_00990 [Candidatus Roizmanbacteria bacterium RIFCSPLOWO2_01_FULL_37_12]|uniref:Enoyl reductase (ER) domain-containing protein n=1 Tax=Candidatus Roizmanbacteria bacterium RIFCSPLOWO2_01_FULL_37_12 TaxID=1802056 RepID=A0A1F7IGB9_9BACT|nr:MAG: hypothetical protein A3D76_00215 [Candidatus Roizmanbacteria bacterium RIFCSPHIGHO2_02_FULL_37_9b]OGK42402.1 MAG: hypothetical protein A2954_00990 [Candidatus Roizmanbacteria bacterium RIFCSPLOWO2_01_FULL_37_12]